MGHPTHEQDSPPFSFINIGLDIGRFERNEIALPVLSTTEAKRLLEVGRQCRELENFQAMEPPARRQFLEDTLKGWATLSDQDKATARDIAREAAELFGHDIPGEDMPPPFYTHALLEERNGNSHDTQAAEPPTPREAPSSKIAPVQEKVSDAPPPPVQPREADPVPQVEAKPANQADNPSTQEVGDVPPITPRAQEKEGKADESSARQKPARHSGSQAKRANSYHQYQDEVEKLNRDGAFNEIMEKTSQERREILFNLW
ncbi:MAG TPA: hypothetical protein DF383_05530, partial [Deltaproteobacteria bacterium]|nr:hypothetical protein [Deltaproteobacteria bacterium]